MSFVRKNFGHDEKYLSLPNISEKKSIQNTISTMGLSFTPLLGLILVEFSTE